MTAIEWTDVTWNPVTGCNKVSPGCKNCYAERMAKRLQAMGNPRYANGFEVTLHPDKLTAPLGWKKPRMVFVNSMSDLFHQEVPDSFIARVFGTMEQCPRHTFQVLTKRPERALTMSAELPWPANIWLGASVENGDYLHRIGDLRQTPAHTRFLSLEPLLGPLGSLELSGIHWVIAGGESGPGARPVDGDWLRSIRDQCQDADVAFFFKQWAAYARNSTARP